MSVPFNQGKSACLWTCQFASQDTGVGWMRPPEAIKNYFLHKASLIGAQFSSDDADENDADRDSVRCHKWRNLLRGQRCTP